VIGRKRASRRAELARLAVPALLAGLALLTLPVGAALAHDAVPSRAADPVRAAVASRTAASPRVAFILIDTNASPSTTRLPNERQQAMTYAHALPADVEVGLIVFGDNWRTALRPTTSRSALAAALGLVKPAGNTSNGIRQALPGAVAEIGQLGASAHSRILVLSNGELLGQPVPVPSVPVDVVATSDDPDDFPATLRRLATASGGTVGSATDVAALAAVFPPLRTSPTPTPRPTHSTRPPAPAASGSAQRPGLTLGSVLMVVFVAFFALALIAIRSMRQGERRLPLAGQIERYGPTAVSTAAAPVARQQEASDSKVTRRAVGLMSQVLQSRRSEPRLARRLDRAGISRQPAEWALLCVCVCVTLVAVCTLLLGDPVLGVLLGVVMGWAAMHLVLNLKISKRRGAFDDQLPNVLQLIASSIQSGFSLAQAFDAVVREDVQPASGEFARALAETRLGVDLADALDGIVDRLESTDLGWVVMAIRIQRETGGNLAEVLRNTVATMRERAYLRRQVRTLSAEGRLSAYVLLALPVLIGGWLFFSDPTYMHPLYTTFMGVSMLVIATVLVVVGALWMRNLINVEV
jgi:Flp pilus assembly protein TadB